MWTNLFTTAVIPVALLLYFNSRIFIDLLNSKVLGRQAGLGENLDLNELNGNCRCSGSDRRGGSGGR